MYNASQVDSASVQILDMFHPIMNTDSNPLQVTGDGNCLYRSVSLAMTGTQDYHSLLRLMVALELILNRSSYDTKRKYNDFLNDTRIVTSDYKELVADAMIDKTFAEMAHMYALSAALCKPVQSYYPPQLNSELSSALTELCVVETLHLGPTVVSPWCGHACLCLKLQKNLESITLCLWYSCQFYRFRLSL